MRSSHLLWLAFFVSCISTAAHPQVRFSPPAQDVVQKRLLEYPGKNADRAATIKALFAEAGCGDHLQEQKAQDKNAPNVVCILPGSSEEEIIVGAHYDRVDDSDGVVDNWSGAS